MYKGTERSTVNLRLQQILNTTNIEYVEIVKDIYLSERTTNWNLHLVAVGNMLNLVAAAGHVSYATSAALFLPNHPSVYQYFEQVLCEEVVDIGQVCGY